MLFLFGSSKDHEFVIEIVKESLLFHQLNLEVLVGLIMVSYQVINGLKNTGKSLAVVFSFLQKIVFSEYLDHVDEAIAGFFAEAFYVRSYVCEDCDDRLVNRSEESGTVVNQLVN